MSCGDKHEQSLFGDGQPSEVPAEVTHPARSRRSRRKGDLFARKQPQSQEKHEILEFYLKPWIRIISRHFGHAVYIDGFAGPGTCRTGEVCSPVLAAQTLTKYAGRGARIHLFAIEAAKQHFEALMENLDQYRSSIHIVYITKEPLGYNIMNDIWIKREKEREVNRRAGMIRLFDLEDMIATQDMLQDFLAQTFSGQTIIRKAVTAKTLMHHRSFRSDVERAIDSLVRQGRAVIQPGRRTDKDYQRLTFV